MSDKNELMTTGSGFLALADFNMNESMAEELEGLEGGFDRVKIPSGGATMFELPGDEADEPEMVKEFSAVILHHHPVLQYYKEKYTGGSNPPDCGSFDGVTGEGTPGGVCAQCPQSVWLRGEQQQSLQNPAQGIPAAGGRAVPADPLPAHRLDAGVFPLHQAPAQ